MRWSSFTSLAASAVLLGGPLVPSFSPPAAAADAPDREIELGGRNAAVWLPPAGPARHPLVLFSHGVRGCKTQSTYLMRALARAGYLVVAPDHEDRGTSCPTQLPGPDDLPEGFLDEALVEGSDFYDERGEDLRNVRAALDADATLGPLIDPTRVALAGHSLGGYAALGAAGAWPAPWKMPGVAAVVALAPFVQPFAKGGTPSGIGVPILFQVGSDDGWVTPWLDRTGVFVTPAGSCKVVYKGADHFAWTDSRPGFHDPTAADAVAFLRAVFANQTLTTAVLTRAPTADATCK